MPNSRFLFDTNIFNHVLDGKIPIGRSSECKIFVTHIQRNEITQTKSESRKAELFSVLEKISPDKTSTKTAIWCDTPWDDSEWSANDDLYDRLLSEIIRLDEKRRKNFNQSRDARIAETAIRAGMTLVTDDRNLASVIRKFGGSTTDLLNFRMTYLGQTK